MREQAHRRSCAGPKSALKTYFTSQWTFNLWIIYEQFNLFIVAVAQLRGPDRIPLSYISNRYQARDFPIYLNGVAGPPASDHIDQEEIARDHQMANKLTLNLLQASRGGQRPVIMDYYCCARGCDQRGVE